MTGMKAVRALMAGVLVLAFGIVFSGCCCSRIAALEEQNALALSKADVALSTAQAAKKAADEASKKAGEAADSAAQANAAAQTSAKSAQKAEAVFMKNMGK